MRLLSFLTEIEKALIAESPSSAGSAWETTRVVNFHHGLARLTLTPRAGNTHLGGAIFVQAFTLADASFCLKISLNWTGQDSFPVLAVYSTPTLDWKSEASRIAGSWREGPHEVVTSSDLESGFHSLVSMAG
jgi:hypothetical protein